MIESEATTGIYQGQTPQVGIEVTTAVSSSEMGCGRGVKYFHQHLQGMKYLPASYPDCVTLWQRKAKLWVNLLFREGGTVILGI